MNDSELMLYGELGCWSLLGVEGLGTGGVLLFTLFSCVVY